MKIKLPRNRDIETIRKWLLEHKYTVEELARYSRISINKITMWKMKCDVIDPGTESKLFIAWTNYKDYSITEASVALGITDRSFRYYVKKHGITKYQKGSRPPVGKKERKKIEYEHIPTPKNKEELDKLLEKDGIFRLSKMMRVPKFKIQRLMRRYGSKSSRTKAESRNKYNTKKWLTETYVDKKMSLTACSKIAEVNPQTISNWLVSHGMMPRTKNGTI